MASALNERQGSRGLSSYILTLVALLVVFPSCSLGAIQAAFLHGVASGNARSQHAEHTNLAIWICLGQTLNYMRTWHSPKMKRLPGYETYQPIHTDVSSRSSDTYAEQTDRPNEKMRICSARNQISYIDWANRICSRLPSYFLERKRSLSSIACQLAHKSHVRKTLQDPFKQILEDFWAHLWGIECGSHDIYFPIYEGISNIWNISLLRNRIGQGLKNSSTCLGLGGLAIPHRINLDARPHDMWSSLQVILMLPALCCGLASPHTTCLRRHPSRQSTSSQPTLSTGRSAPFLMDPHPKKLCFVSAVGQSCPGCQSASISYGLFKPMVKSTNGEIGDSNLHMAHRHPHSAKDFVLYTRMYRSISERLYCVLRQKLDMTRAVPGCRLQRMSTLQTLLRMAHTMPPRIATTLSRSLLGDSPHQPPISTSSLCLTAPPSPRPVNLGETLCRHCLGHRHDFLVWKFLATWSWNCEETPPEEISKAYLRSMHLRFFLFTLNELPGCF